MSFDEYLLSIGKENYIKLIEDAYKSNKSLFSGIHDELLNLYKIFLITGGMPEAVKLVRDIDNLYIMMLEK